MKPKDYNKKQCGTVKMNALVPVIGTIGSLFFGIVLVLTILNNAGFLCYVIFGALFILSIGMILTINQKIDYTPQEFIYRDILRISHKYNYTEVKKIRYSKDVWLKVRHRTILIDSMCIEGHKFARIAMQYSSNADIITDEKVKLWNGNIKNPGEFVFIYIFSAVALVIFCIWGVFSFKDIHINDFTIISGTITDCKFDKHEDGDDRLTILLSDKENTFYTWKIKENSDVYSKLKDDIEHNKAFDIFIVEKELEYDATQIYSMECDGSIYIPLDLDAINKHNRETRMVFIIFTGICFLALILYIVISSYVMCHADKYPKAIKLFVKDGYIASKKENKHFKHKEKHKNHR